MFYQNIKNSLETLDSEFITLDELMNFYNNILDSSSLSIKKVGLSELSDWGFDSDGSFSHKSGRFFSVNSVEYRDELSMILSQPEIGLLCNFMTIVDETAYFLIQFKEEPGNINKVQLSPTIQATKSNYSKVHGGSLPNYWEEYTKYSTDSSVVSFNLSEQGTRYWQKYNNNKIILTPFFEEKNNFKWLTLGQILQFKKYDNSINSCLRSCLSLIHEIYNEKKSDQKINSSAKNLQSIDRILNSKNFKNVKSFYQKKTDILKVHNNLDNFDILGIEVSTKNREVSKWSQPLVLESKKQQYFLFTIKQNGETKYIWSIDKEPGYKKGFAVGPSLKNISFNNDFEQKLNCFKKYTINDQVTMSEEGGRFLNFEVEHIFSEINEEDFNPNSFEFLVLNKSETNEINKMGYLSMEARSLFFLGIV